MNTEINTPRQEFLLESLKYILNLVETDSYSKRFSNRSGICNAVGELYHDTYCDGTRIIDEQMKTAFKTWPEFSGNTSFPIPSDGDKTPREYYMKEDNLWQGRQLEKRISLLKHMIEVI